MTAFEHNILHINKPKARQLNNRYPKIVNNFLFHFEQFSVKNKLLQRTNALEEAAKYPLRQSLQQLSEEINALRCRGVA
jgi:hypothetical protein